MSQDSLGCFRPHRNYFQDVIDLYVYHRDRAVVVDKYAYYVQKFGTWERHVRTHYSALGVRAVMTFLSLKQNRAIGAVEVLPELPITEFTRHPHYEIWVAEAERGFQYVKKCIYYGDKLKAIHQKLP